ncbi:DUF6538 domain-containing protein [Pseudoxanthomonas mexicana]|uniref:DUF6538 domain-containing protein n=1 Tax=Pseudoxanthomonas mexicana TaxID=128785 RepID=UPI0031F300FA
MRVAHYLVRGTSGLFYVRIRVPSNLRQTIGASVIKRATGTRCPRAALACALVLQARYAQAFNAMRRGEPVVKPPAVDEIRANLGEGRGSEYVLEHGPNGLRIEATDEADHARAMNALANIGRVGQWATSATPTPPSSQAMDMDEAVRMWVGFNPANTDTSVKPHDGAGGVSCSRESVTARSSSVRLSA